MPIQLRVEAEVVDLTTDIPIASDIFLVDTNVWFWTAYSKASVSIRHRQRGYDRYLKQALSTGSRLYVSGLSQSELIHQIERTELDIFQQTQAAVVQLKEFRHNHIIERAKVVQEAQTAWAVVENVAEIIDLRVDKGMTNRVITRLQNCCLDGYDLISAEVMIEHGIPQVLTDDGDFVTVPGILVFTANRNVLQAAATQGKLIVR